MKHLLANSPATLLAIIVTALISLGIVMVYSASGARAGLEMRRATATEREIPAEELSFHHSAHYLERQVAYTLVGLVILILLMKAPIDSIERLAPIILLGAVVLLLLVLVFGKEINGARRWLQVGPLSLQPSEFAKIALVIYMARFLSQKGEEIRDWKRGFLPAVAVVGMFCVLVVLERDLGTIVVMGTVMLGMWALARVRVSHLATIVVVAIPALVFLIFQHSYRIKRILAFFNPEKFALTDGFQLNQSLIAVGSGGIWGRGLGLGFQKYHFLSEAHTDFIFAIVCEELGMIGALSVVLLFLAFTLLGFRISYRAPDYFGGLVVAGLTLTIACAAYINFFVVLGMAPTKGLALPFLTCGGSSMIASLVAVGLMINVANYTALSRGGE